MELDITHMVEDEDQMPMLSGSVAELGQDAGKLTWRNSVEYGRNHPLLSTDDERERAREHFSEYGAWSAEEIAAWSDEELEGLVCQEAAAAIREMEVADDYADYVRLCEEGTCSGRLYRDDNGRWYLYLGM